MDDLLIFSGLCMLFLIFFNFNIYIIFKNNTFNIKKKINKEPYKYIYNIKDEISFNKNHNTILENIIIVILILSIIAIPIVIYIGNTIFLFINLVAICIAEIISFIIPYDIAIAENNFYYKHFIFTFNKINCMPVEKIDRISTYYRDLSVFLNNKCSITIKIALDKNTTKIVSLLEEYMSKRKIDVTAIDENVDEIINKEIYKGKKNRNQIIWLLESTLWYYINCGDLLGSTTYYF